MHEGEALQVGVREPTVIASWVTVALNAFSVRGVSPEDALARAGLQRETLKNSLAPIPLSQVIALWNFACHKIGCDTLGLECARVVNFGSFQSVGYAVAASANLYDAFVRITAYANAATNAACTFLYEQHDRFVFGFIINPLACEIPRACVDMPLAIFRFVCRLLHNEKPGIIALEMARTTLENIDLYRKVFTPDIILGSSRYAIHFNKSYFLKPLPTANEVIARANDACVQELLQKMADAASITTDISSRVRRKIGEHLKSEENVSIERIAASMAMSERNLQRSLHDENTTFRELLDLERQDLARRYLIESRESICQVAHRLGFSDSANFGRAFKRWFGCNPLEFRELYQLEGVETVI